MNPSPQQTTLYKTLAQSLTGQTTDLSAFPEEETLLLATQNGISPLLAHQSAQGQVKGISEEMAGKLTSQARSLAAHDLLLNNSTGKLLTLLHENGIRALLLKGTPMSLLCYEKPYLRVRCDTDLYIAETDLEHCITLLAENNYKLSGLGKRTYSSKQFGASIQSFKQFQSVFDIHYKLSNRIMFQTTLPFDECWQEKQAVPALGPNAWTLSNRDLLIHACIHRIAHGRGTERNRLIWLYDIHLLWQAMTEEEKETFVKKAQAKKIGALCADALKTSEELFPLVGAARAAIQSIDELQKNKKTEPTAPLINASKPRWALADLMAIKGITAKLAFAKELILKK